MQAKSSNRFLSKLFLVFFTMSCSFASTPIPDAAKIGFDAISLTNMRALLYFIAADELEGRNTGTRGLKIAAKFLETQYTLAGLTPAPGQESMLQQFKVEVSRVNEQTTLTIANETQTQLRLYQDFLMPSMHTKQFATELPLVFAGFSDKSLAADSPVFTKAKGKVLLVFEESREMAENPLPADSFYRRKLRTLRREMSEQAQKAGVAAVFFINDRLNRDRIKALRRFYDNSRQKLSGYEEDIPQIQIGTEIADKLLDANGITSDSLKAKFIAEQKSTPFDLKTKVRIDIRADIQHKTTQNVVAYLEGSHPVLKEEVVVFGAHYDHVGMNGSGDIFNGADDDGSGTVGMLEIARAFARNKARPQRSLLFVSHAGEEKGLLGSRYYTDHPIIPLEKTIAQLNIDMIGRNEANSIYIIGSNFLSQELHSINERANETVGMALDYKYNALDDPNRFYYRSDHFHYAKHGIPIIFYFSGTHEDYHQPTDTVEKIDFAKMQKVARLVYLTGWEVASLNHPLSKDGLLIE